MYYLLIQRFPFISLFILLRRTPKTGVETSNTCVILDGFSINIWHATSSAVDVLHLGLETILIYIYIYICTYIAVGYKFKIVEKLYNNPCSSVYLNIYVK